MRARRERPCRRAAKERDEIAPLDFEHRPPPDRTFEIGALSAPLCSLKGYHPEGAADRLLHCGISVASGDGFMAEMGHDPKGSG
jgi:hypothetical protein